MYIRLSLWKLVVLQTPKVPLAVFGYSSMAELGESTMASDLTFELRNWKCLHDSLRGLTLYLHFLPKHQWLFLWSSRVRNIKKMKPLEAQVTNSLLQKLPIVRMHRSSCMNHSMLIITSSKTGSIPTLSGRTLCTGSCSLICNSIGFCIPSSKLKFSGTRMRNPTAFGLTMWRNPKQFNGISHFSETG